MKILSLLLVAGMLPHAFVSNVSEASSFDDDDWVAALDAYAVPLVAAGHLSGTLVVAKQGEVAYERSFGLANHEHRVPNRPETRFCVASVTKPMTQVLVAQLAQEGKLDPNDKVSRWLPGFPRGDEITVMMLLTHTAGMPHRVTEDRDETIPRTAAEVVEFASRSPPV